MKVQPCLEAIAALLADLLFLVLLPVVGPFGIYDVICDTLAVQALVQEQMVQEYQDISYALFHIAQWFGA
ncbi:hypothetical protein LF95_23365 [Thalassospira sp. TSL5-1]|nr:hypothetical protein LF95_23365 [Thalassospira sp. TSL5-1]